MKRLIVIVGIVMLLAGCAEKSAEQPAQTDQPTIAPPQTENYHIGSSAVEKDTNGAVLAYEIKADAASDVSMVGDKLLLTQTGAQMRLTTMKDDGTVLADKIMDSGITDCQSAYNMVACYKSDTNEVIYFDQTLNEISRFALPEKIDGAPVFSPDGSMVFYCVGQQIRAYDTTMNIARPVKNHSCKTQSLIGCYFDGKILACRLEYETGQTSTIYLSAQDGRTLYTDPGLLALQTQSADYLTIRMDGTIRQIIFGALDEEPACFQIGQEAYVAPALALGGVVQYTVNEENNLQLSFLEIASGRKTAEITIPGMGAPRRIVADNHAKCLWLLAEKEETGAQMLYAWKIGESPSTSDTVYPVTPVYTENNPDTQGLADCEKRASQLGDTYGVEIRIWRDAVEKPGQYVLKPEYQTETINAALDELESALRVYPKRFLYNSVKRLIRICIVRSISDGKQSAQYWQDSNAFVVLSSGDHIGQEFTKAVSYIFDSHVLGNSNLYDDWASLNPKGFSYGETADDRFREAFADSAGMTSVTEDRSSIFFHSMQPDNAQVFRSQIMQQKLKKLCMGIRDAWGLDGSADYPWERYLTEPLPDE